jgi:hypothetical protein
MAERDLPPSAESEALMVHLAEYESLRGEQMQRLESQNQAFNYLLVVIGVAVTGAITLATQRREVDAVTAEMQAVLAFWLVMALPLVTAPLGFIFFDNEMAVHSIGSHLYHEVRPKLAKRTGDDEVLQPTLEFAHLHPWSRGIHGWLSRCRWTLFLLPAAGPWIAMSLYLSGAWLAASGSWAKVAESTAFVLFGVDVAMTALLVFPIWWSFFKYKTR